MKQTRHLLIALALGTMLTSCGASVSTATVTGPAAYVDPYIGSGGHGHVFVGASVPFGAIQAGPQNIHKGWDWCSGYHHSDSIVIGFAHTHLSGTGCTDMGDVQIMPYTGELRSKRGRQEDIGGSCSSYYSHDNESVSPGYYSLKMDNGVRIEMTASTRTALHRITYPEAEGRRLLINLEEGNGDGAYDTYLRQTDAHTVEGYRFSKGWGPHKVFFALTTDKPIRSLALFDADTPSEGSEIRCKGAKGVLTFDDEKQVMVKVAISSVSSANALENLRTEIPGWDFKAVQAEAIRRWNDELAAIDIETADETAKKIFYTAMYHAFIAPTTYCDVNGEFRGHDDKVVKDAAWTNYSTFSLWDTYRALHPLFTLIRQDRLPDIVNSMLSIYDQQSKLPIWALPGAETNTMPGYSAVPVISDAILKGIGGFDTERAYRAMKASTTYPLQDAVPYVLENEFIPDDKAANATSIAMEYAVGDWGVAQVAKKLGNTADYEEYLKRGKYYTHYFDKSINFIRPKLENGEWLTPYDPFESIHGVGHFCEGNGWQYTFFVPQHPEGLIALMGGDRPFTAKLDEFFTAEGDLGEEASMDISGLIGMYAHGNEPSHHMAYLYNYVGQPWKTQELTRRLLHEMYAPTPEGIIGNEDCGQMSAWYVFSSLGFYPVCPGSNEFALTAPQFPKAVVRLANGRTLTVTADNPRRSVYIASVTLDGKPIDRNYITYDELMQGGELHFALRPRPDYERGTDDAAAPHSLTRGEAVSIPYTTQNVSLFAEPLAVALATTTAGAEIRYTLDGSEPTEASALYAAPVPVDRSLTLKAKGFKPGAAPSRTLTLEAEKAVFRKGAPAGETAMRPGVAYSYYEGVFSCVDDIRKGKYVSSGTMPAPSIAQAPQEDHFGYIFTGSILIPERGVWEFMTKSDDGSVLTIGDRKVVDNDGSHASVMATGRVALEAGLHPYTLLYFEDYEGQDLSWGWKAPGAEGFEAIPEANLRLTN